MNDHMVNVVISVTTRLPYYLTGVLAHIILSSERSKEIPTRKITYMWQLWCGLALTFILLSWTILNENLNSVPGALANSTHKISMVAFVCYTILLTPSLKNRIKTFLSMKIFRVISIFSPIANIFHWIIIFLVFDNSCRFDPDGHFIPLFQMIFFIILILFTMFIALFFYLPALQLENSIRNKWKV